MRNSNLEENLPTLKTTEYQVTSPRDVQYNCIAWAAGVNDCWWWPTKDCYWPSEAPKAVTVEAFIAAYRTQGYEVCPGPELEEGIEKIAIYAASGEPKHAARQLQSGIWTSKCGPSFDISHVLDGVSGVLYGNAVVFMSRPRMAT